MSAYLENTNCRIFLIDASIYIFRAWHIYPDTITDDEGRPINALYGFLYFLSDFLAQVNPRYIAIAFDGSRTENFRKTLYPSYKANRPPTPEELKYQFQLCEQACEKLGINCIKSRHYEADDLIATMANRYKQMDFGVTVVSADKDLAQIMTDEHDFLWDFARNEVYDAQRIEDKFGVKPNKISQLLALAGDRADNIPGANGIGIKTAARLLKKFSNLEELLSNPDKFKQCNISNTAKTNQAIYENVDQIRLFHKLTELITLVEIKETNSCEWLCPCLEKIDEVLLSYNADRMLRSRFSRLAAYV